VKLELKKKKKLILVKFELNGIIEEKLTGILSHRRPASSG